MSETQPSEKEKGGTEKKGGLLHKHKHTKNLRWVLPEHAAVRLLGQEVVDKSVGRDKGVRPVPVPRSVYGRAEERIEHDYGGVDVVDQGADLLVDSHVVLDGPRGDHQREVLGEDADARGSRGRNHPVLRHDAGVPLVLHERLAVGQAPEVVEDDVARGRRPPAREGRDPRELAGEPREAGVVDLDVGEAFEQGRGRGHVHVGEAVFPVGDEEDRPVPALDIGGPRLGVASLLAGEHIGQRSGKHDADE